MAGTLSGTVMDIRNMQPVSGAAVAAEPGGKQTTTGDDGTFSLPLDAGSYDLTVNARGYEQWVGTGIVVIDDVDTTVPLVLHRSDM